MKHIKLFEEFIVEKKSYANSAFLFGGFFTGIQRKGIGKAVISDLFKSNPKIENLLLYTQDDAIGFWKKIGGNVVSQGNDKNGTLRYFVQINRNDVDSSVGPKELRISYKNKSTKTSKLSKGEYDIKMGRQKIGFFFVRDVGTIEENPMDIIIESVTVNKVEFSYKPLVNETYELLEGGVSYEDLNDILNEGIFSFIKGIFMNPLQKRKLKKLGDELFKVKVQIQKLEIEENDIDKMEDELKSKDSNYISNPSIANAKTAEDKKAKALGDKESIIIDKMDMVAGDNETLTKYVNKIKLEIRMKASEATIKLADDEMSRILNKLQKKDAKEIKTLGKELAKAS